MTQPAVPALIAVLSGIKTDVGKQKASAAGAKTSNNNAATTMAEMAKADTASISKINSSLGRVKASDALAAAKKKMEEAAEKNREAATLAGEAAALYHEAGEHLQTSITALGAVGKGGA